MREFTATGMQLLAENADRRIRTIMKGYNAGVSSITQRLTLRWMLEDYVERHGEPWNRQPWQFKGPSLADMFSGRIMKRIPRELRRIYAPYP